MKKYKIAIISILLLALAFVGISFNFVDDIIPTHIGINGKPDQLGSKYFLLIFVGIMAVIGITMVILSYSNKLTENYKKYMLLTGVIMEVLFLGLLVLFTVYGILYTENKEPFDIAAILSPLIGIMMIILGNYFPKIEKNRTLGIKTYWSMYNEVTWQKTHRFGGFVSMILGVLLVIIGLIFKDIVSVIIVPCLLILWFIIITVASYIYYKQEIIKK